MDYFFKDISTQDGINTKIQITFIIFDLITFIILFKVKAYYGKFYNKFSIFPTISSKLSWIIQEIPCVIVTIFFMISEKETNNYYIRVFFIFPFLFHYLHRSLYFPFQIKSAKNIPIEITILAFTFCCFNSLMINRSVFKFINYSIKDVKDISTLFGLLIFSIGMFINIFHDYYLIQIRNNNSGYIIPKGYLFNYISCPNYFGEIIEWFGFFLFNKSLSSFIFLISTFTNLFPRAIKYNQFYKEKFKEEYSKNIRSIFPFLI